MNKKCINCGTALPDAASFCPYCATVQTPKEQVHIPRLWRKRAIAALTILLAAAMILGIYVYRNRPKVYEGEGNLTYSDDDGTYDIVLGYFEPPEGRQIDCIKDRIITINAGETWHSYTHLCVYPANGSLKLVPEFMDKVEDIDLTIEALDDKEPFYAFKPQEMLDMPFALRSARFSFSTECGSNRLTWTLRMKNGDELRLYQHATVVEATD